MKRCPALLLMLTLLCGCAPVAREPDQLALVRVLGVDGSGPVILAAVCGRNDQQEPGRGRAEAENFEQARREVVWSGRSEELALTGVSYLIVGPDVDLESVLFAVLEDTDLGVSATVWLAKEGAQFLLDACDDPNADLQKLTLRGVKAPTVAQAVAALTTDGWIELPCLGVQNRQLEERGTSRWTTDN